MTAQAFLQASGAFASILVVVLAMAHAAQCGVRHLALKIRKELAGEVLGEPLITLPVAWLKRYFLVWLMLNAVWLVAIAALPWVQCVTMVAILTVLGMLALIDAETGILPNELILILMLLAWLYSWVTWSQAMPRLDLLWGMTLGYALPMLFDFAYRLVMQRQAMGQGDAKLLAALGLWLGVRALADVWIVACVLLLVYTAMLKSVKQGSLYLKMCVPFGPFLVLAANAIVIYESF